MTSDDRMILMRRWRRPRWVQESGIGGVALTFLLLLAGIFQLGLVVQGYGLQWAKSAWRTRDMTAMERSARFLLGSTGKDFVEFLTQQIPEDMSIAVPDAAGALSEQNNLQFFFLPRAVVACPCAGAKDNGWTPDCAVCLSSGDLAVPAVKGFPPTKLMADQHEFVQFPGPNDVYRGVYLPGVGGTPPSQDRPGWSGALMTDGAAILRGVTALFLLVLLGAAIAWLLLGEGSLTAVVPLALPVGLGAVTWLTFVVAWASGGKVTLVTFVGVYSLLTLIAGGSLIAWGRQSARRSRVVVHVGLRQVGWRRMGASGVLMAVVLLTLAASCGISVARAYSIYDDIANWALKGYAIAHFGSIFAGESWGGHGLAYPQNLHLGIALFRIIDGDALPGSKLIFSGFIGSLVLGCMAFWRRTGLSPVWSVAGGLTIASIPIVFFHSTTGYANLPFAAYLVLGALCLKSGIQTGRHREVLAGSVLLGLAAWTRPEGAVFGLLGILSLAVTAPRRQLRAQSLSCLLPFSILAGLWVVFGSRYQAGDEMGTTLRAFVAGLPATAFDVASAKVLTGFAIRSLTSLGTWGLTMPLLAGLAVITLASRVSGRRPVIDSSIIPASIWLLAAFAMLYAAWPSHPDYLQFLTYSFDRAMFPGMLLVLWAVIGSASVTLVSRPTPPL